MGIVIAIIIFSLTIIFHELGHFILAKINKIRVDEFSLGLGPTLICRRAVLTVNLCGQECLLLRQAPFLI